MIHRGAKNLRYVFKYACENWNIQLVKLLIDHGADNWNDGLSAACYNISIVQMMINRSKDHNIII